MCFPAIKMTRYSQTDSTFFTCKRRKKCFQVPAAKTMTDYEFSWWFWHHLLRNWLQKVATEEILIFKADYDSLLEIKLKSATQKETSKKFGRYKNAMFLAFQSQFCSKTSKPCRRSDKNQVMPCYQNSFSSFCFHVDVKRWLNRKPILN